MDREINRENVVKGLERILDYDPMFRVAHDDEFSQYAADALALLKAQEAHIVTKDDFANADEYGWLPAWAEEKIGGVVYCECITVDALKDFGVRYWTSCPSEAQREAVKWE